MDTEDPRVLGQAEDVLGVVPEEWGAEAPEVEVWPDPRPYWDQERWKLPLTVFIEELYRKGFGRARPEFVLSIEERARKQEKKKAKRRETKLRLREAWRKTCLGFS